LRAQSITWWPGKETRSRELGFE